MKVLLRSILPPIFLKVFKKIIFARYFSKKYGSWNEALKRSSSYDKEIIFRKTLTSSRLARDGKVKYERDSVVFDEVQYDWQLLAFLMLICSDAKRLNLLDFGGALGTSYRQNKKYLDLINIEKKWAIIEQKKFVEMGKSEFEDDNLFFYEKISDINHEIDLVLFGSSLCYLEKPYEILKNILELNPKYIIINRTPFTLEFDEFICIQRVPSNIYKASYPFWTLSKPKLINFLSHKYQLVEEWTDSLQAYPEKSYGLLFRMK